LLPLPNRPVPKRPYYFQPRPPVGHCLQLSAATAKRAWYSTRFVAAGSCAAKTGPRRHFDYPSTSLNPESRV
jgi:hypothetical protein